MKNNWISLLALLVSVIALMFSFRVSNVDFKDYWGFVLGVLTLLVTLLIGWQIYNSIEIKKQMEITRLRQRDIEVQLGNLPIIQCGLHFIQGTTSLHNLPLSAYRAFIYALCSALKCHNYVAIDDSINNMNLIVDNIVITRIVKENIEEKEIQIQNAITELYKDDTFSEIQYRFDLIERKRKEVIEEIRQSTKVN